MDYLTYAAEMARETFTRAVNRPLTHWTLGDTSRRLPRASCGQIVCERDLAMAGLPPTCPLCLRSYTLFQAANV